MQLEHGIFTIYKPTGITSHDVINKVRTLSGQRRVGHGGTLDPFASGVLVVAIGKEYTTKLHEILHNTAKVYRAVVQLGATSTTDDPEGVITEKNVTEIPSRETIEKILGEFRGEVMQVPPAFSAIKQSGRRAYELARQGKKVTLAARKVRIDAIEFIRYQYPELEIEVTCGSGFYMRALTRDIGQALGTGAYCKELERIRVGEYSLEHAITV